MSDAGGPRGSGRSAGGARGGGAGASGGGGRGQGSSGAGGGGRSQGGRGQGSSGGGGGGRSQGGRGQGSSGAGGGGRSQGGGGQGGRPVGGGGRGTAPQGGAGRRTDGPRGADRGRAGEPDNSERRGGPRLAPTGPRLPEPRIADGVTGRELDRGVHQQLRTLSKENAEGVAQHLVMVALMMDAGELDAALAHAETAVRRAGRVPAAREALGMVAYRRGEFARALGEFRTVRRLSGSTHLLPLMVDCERGLGRHARALDLAASAEVGQLGDLERAELAIVVSGVRRDLGQNDIALLALQIPQLKRAGAAYHRLHYAYADALLALGRTDEAREWFARAASGDHEQETDAVERMEELDGVLVTDLLADEDEEEAPGDEELGAAGAGLDALRDDGPPAR